MAKTDTTKELEMLIFFESKADGAGIYGAFEVALGEAYGNEYVDYITMKSNGEFRCYEIKQSYNDFHSKAKISFYGDYNYYVMTEKLYNLLKEKQETPFWNCGVYIRKYNPEGESYLELIKKAPKHAVTPWMRYELTHCMVRSLSRLTTEKMKYLKELKEETDSKNQCCPICGQHGKIYKTTSSNAGTKYKIDCPDHIRQDSQYYDTRKEAWNEWNQYCKTYSSR